MGRIRNIKPQFFKDSDLFDAEKESGLPVRVAYAGLWTIADRSGRFKWKAREIKTDILPYDEVDMEDVLQALVKFGFIFKYKAAGFEYGYVKNFERHQFINRNEAQSTIPAPPENSNAQSDTIEEQKPPEIHRELLVVLDTDTDTDGLTQTQDSTAPQAALPAKGTRKTLASLPENFPTAENLRDACAYWDERDRADLSALDEADAFRAHHLAHGKRMADWGQAWVTWYTRAVKFNRKPNGHDYGNRGKSSAHQNFAEGALLAAQDFAAKHGPGN